MKSMELCTVEGTQHEYTIDQCIANMIKLGADLLEINLRQGYIVNAITIWDSRKLLSASRQAVTFNGGLSKRLKYNCL